MDAHSSKETNYSLKSLFSLLSVLLLVLALVLTLGNTQQRRTLSNRAAEPMSPTPPENGDFMQSIKLSGTRTSPQYIKMPDTSSLALGSNFTLEAWIKPSIPTTPLRQYHTSHIITKPLDNKNPIEGEYRNAYGLQFTVGYVGADYFSTNYTFSVALAGLKCKNASVGSTDGFNSANLTKWQHVVGIYKAGRMYLYVNGKLMHTNDVSMYGEPCHSVQPLLIGAGPNDQFGSNPNFQGEIDEVRISSTNQYHGDFKPPTRPFDTNAFVRGLWRFNGNFNDSTTNGNNGTQVGTISFEQSTVPTPTPVLPTLTPTMTPVPNSHPTINRQTLPVGMVGRDYVATISANDLNIDNNLTMALTISPTGSGLSVIPCTTATTTLKVVRCQIKGKALQPGQYTVKAAATDQIGGVSDLNFKLVIMPGPTATPTPLP